MASESIIQPIKSAVMERSTDKKREQLKGSTAELTKDSRITSDFGTRQNDTDNWLRVATNEQTGPMLLEDTFMREKIHRFDHERIPERVVHARGAAAHGVFRLHESAADVTRAGVLTDTSRATPVFVRFSTVLGSRGSADTVRDVRGFAIKFYTDEGNWDLVGNNIPVFFIQDAAKFPDLIHAAKPEPDVEVPQAQTAHNNFWDFVTLHTEATHMYMWAMSDRTIPRSYRMMQGFGVNTFTLENEKGERHFVKFHLTPELGVHSLVWDEALKLAGQDPDFHRKDLSEAINSGTFPKWKFGIQTISAADEHNFDFDVLDATKVWPEDRVPVRYIGELELNRNVDEYFPETEQVAFCTSHVVPGIGFSDDPLLQGRNFSYFDTQISRLGINWEELPINRPVCPVMNFNRDGAMRHRITPSSVNYWPNRFDVNPPATKSEGAYTDFPQAVQGVKVRAKSAKFADHYSQARLFYNSLSDIEKRHVVSALSFELDHCDDPVVYEHVAKRLHDIDIDLAQQVARAIGAPEPESKVGGGSGKGTGNDGRRAPKLSQMDFLPSSPTVASRRIAILVADGYDARALEAITRSVEKEKAIPFVIGVRRNKISPAAGDSSSKSDDGVVPAHHLEGMRSTMFDAVFVPGGQQSVETLRKNGRAVHWVREAFGHLKAIGASSEGVSLIETALAGVLGEKGISVASQNRDDATVVDSYGVVTVGNSPAEEGLGSKGVIGKFLTVVATHRCWKRESDGFASMVAY